MAENLNNLGLKYKNGSGVPVNYTVAMKYFKTAARIGNANAMVNIGKLYQDGLGVAKNNYEALGWYKAAANLGNIEAMYLAARLYQESSDIPNHNELALSFYEKAATAGYEEAMFPLACLYEEEYYNFRNQNPQDFRNALETGQFQPMRYIAKAFNWFKRAAERGNVEAMFRIGQKYEENYCTYGKERENDLIQALEWYFKAADAGHHQEAMFKLATIFDTACYAPVVPHDAKTAWYWYFRAADAGHYEAMYEVGCRLELERKFSRAFEYFFRAAHAEHYESMLKVGLYYTTAFWGRGNRNVDEGLKWFYRVANCGIPELEAEAIRNINEVKAVLREIQEEQEKRQDCFITTAVCQNLGKPDDCYELTAFRNFRDTWLAAQPDGENLIRKYYSIAPRIVEKINLREDATKIYRLIWDKYLSLCLEHIEKENYAECKEIYIKMVKDLEQGI